MSESPARLRRTAPCVGQHSAEILQERLGYEDARIEELEAGGILGSGHGRMKKVLDGIRVLDLTQWLQGPVCAQYLADFGAEVIHVERPVTGDGARGVRSIKALAIGDWNQYFQVINRNKKSLAIDLKNRRGRSSSTSWSRSRTSSCRTSSAENLKAWGLTWEKLREVNPRLVYATNSGYGHAREINRPSYDINVQALTGIMTRQGEPGEPPIYLGMGSGDTYGGILSALGIMLALHRRRRTGRGQSLDASLYGAQLFMAAPTLQPFLASLATPASNGSLYSTQQSRTQARNPLWNRYPAKDKWVFLCLENTDENWAAPSARASIGRSWPRTRSSTARRSGRSTTPSSSRSSTGS